jgi:hypothetical protein
MLLAMIRTSAPGAINAGYAWPRVFEHVRIFHVVSVATIPPITDADEAGRSGPGYFIQIEYLVAT